MTGYLDAAVRALPAVAVEAARRTVVEIAARGRAGIGDIARGHGGSA